LEKTVDLLEKNCLIAGEIIGFHDGLGHPCPRVEAHKMANVKVGDINDHQNIKLCSPPIPGPASSGLAPKST
jgi:hypothetical protein